MRFLLVMAMATMVAFTGCIKDDKGCSNVKPTDEESQILAFAAANGITPVKHSSGMYYEIVAPGTGATPAPTSTVSVTYKGKFLNGNLFDQSTAPISFKLNGVIEGWTVGLPLISKGGKIKLIVPSSMAYGCNGARTIPSNAILYFEVDLLDVL